MPEGENRLMRRVAGTHNFRLDGIGDILLRARGADVMDIGCNRGMVGYDFALNGAALVHGCDNYEKGIETAREVFIDLRSVSSQFEVVDLTEGPSVLEVFSKQKYDITVMLATYHKLKRIMTPEALTELIKAFAKLTNTFFAWRATSQDVDANYAEMIQLDKDLEEFSFKRIHTSMLSEQLGIAAIWKRP